MSWYRNTVEIVSDQGDLIDKGHLWEKKGELMVLVDDDRYITHSPTAEFKAGV